MKKRRQQQSATWPDVFVSTRDTSRRVSAAVAAGQVRKIAPRVYTGNMTDEAAAIIRRNLWRVVSLLVPGAVVSHRTAIEMRPAEDGSIILTTGYDRRVELPGLTLRFVAGPGPLVGDTQLWDLHLASRARALLESLQPTRARRGVARGLPRARVEEELERDLLAGGEAKLNRIREEARVLAPLMNAEEEFDTLDGIIGTLLNTRRVPLASPVAMARAAGEPYDPARLERFQELFAALRTRPVVPRPDVLPSDVAFANLSFFDAYFSNFIEGTEFELDEAREIVFEGHIPESRPQDAHDVLGTFRVVGGRDFMSRSVRDFPDSNAFEDALRSAHGEILSSRADKRPGEFKKVANVAGDSRFVEPELVSGTLRRGFDISRSLEEPFQRAAAMMFIISEVHPFDDGNGRIARAFMNAELVSGGQRRIVIPTVFRDDYLTGLRVLTRQGHAAPFIEVLDFAQKYTAAIDFSDYDKALTTLRATNAMEAPRPDLKLQMP